MSETGHGDIRGLRERIAWLAHSRNYAGHRRLTALWLRDISALAHAEIGWDSNQWAIAPATAALLPECGGTAVLSGSRRAGLRESIERDFACYVEDRPFESDDAIPPPPSVYVQTDSIDELTSGLARLNVQYVGEAASRIACQLREITLGQLAAPPHRDTPAEHLQVTGESWSFVDGRLNGNGLCRFTELGRPVYRYQRGANWYHTDHSTGILLYLAAQGISAIRWREDRVSNGRAIGRLFVDWGAPLPPLQSRALVLCSGQPPKFSSSAQTAIYANVPKDVADMVARSVHQAVASA